MVAPVCSPGVSKLDRVAPLVDSDETHCVASAIEISAGAEVRRRDIRRSCPRARFQQERSRLRVGPWKRFRQLQPAGSACHASAWSGPIAAAGGMYRWYGYARVIWPQRLLTLPWISKCGAGGGKLRAVLAG